MQTPRQMAVLSIGTSRRRGRHLLHDRSVSLLSDALEAFIQSGRGADHFGVDDGTTCRQRHSWTRKAEYLQAASRHADLAAAAAIIYTAVRLSARCWISVSAWSFR
jgi:hypothetical protein